MIPLKTMKKTECAARCAVFVVLLAGLPVFGETVSVPDIETRIRNSGNEVPSSALPVFRLPPPVELPEEPDRAEPVVQTEPVSPDPAPPVETGVVADVKPAVTGHASVGSGYPGNLAGEFAVAQPEGAYPGYSARFGYASADGYGGKDLGSGFFDRSVGLSLRAFSETGPHPWYAAVSIGDRANGLQGVHPAYSSISRRLAGVNAGVDLYSFGENGPLLSIFLDSQVFSSTAERGYADPQLGADIDDYQGYYLSPGVRLTITPAQFRLFLDVTYALDTVVDLDDLHAVSASFSAFRAFGSLDLGAGAEFHSDTEERYLIPFFARLDWNPEDGLFGPVSLSGGLRSERRTVFDLAREDPFVYLGGMPVHAADWFGSFSVTVKPLTDVRLSSSVDYRKTAFDRAYPVLTDAFTPDQRVFWTLADRESLVVAAGIMYTGELFSVETGYHGELMDELWASHLHEVNVTVSVHDPAPRSFWAAEATLVVMPDSDELPRAGLSGRVYPLPRLSVTLAFEDILPSLFDEVRMINDLYRERSGSVLLSARFEF